MVDAVATVHDEPSHLPLFYSTSTRNTDADATHLSAGHGAGRISAEEDYCKDFDEYFVDESDVSDEWTQR